MKQPSLPTMFSLHLHVHRLSLIHLFASSKAYPNLHLLRNLFSLRSARTHGISIYFFSDNRTSVRFALIYSSFPPHVRSLGLLYLYRLPGPLLCHPIISFNYSVSGSRFLVFSSIGSSQATTLIFFPHPPFPFLWLSSSVGQSVNPS